jgi:ankyrin repeat protein
MADPSAMTVAQLRAELKNRGLDTTGLKADLTARLQAARRSAGNSAHADRSLKRKRDPTTAAVVPTTVRYLQRGAISILDAVAEEIPDVFTEHILPQLDLEDTLRLAQVNKAYNDVVWSADGVRSLNKKINAAAKYCGETRTTPMYWAVKHGNLPAVRACLKSWNVNWIIDTYDEETSSFTALHYAANPQANPKPNPKVVKALIEAGANVNVQDWGGDTPLILAISPTFDHPDPHLAITPRANVPNIIELIKAGADVNLANNGGDTPLHHAVRDAQETSVALLIQAGADVHKVNEDCETPMELAVRLEAALKEGMEKNTSQKKDDKKFREFLSLRNRYDHYDGSATRASAYENIVYLLRYAGAN